MLKLYYASTELIRNQQVFDDLMKKMNEQRRSKVLRCKNEEDRLCSLLAGALLRHGLEKEGLCYEQLEFALTPERKPVLKSNPEFFFSLSHSGEYAVCLIADRQVGVDIENCNRRLFAPNQSARLEAVARRSFSSQEYKAFYNCKEDEKKEVFLKLWTRKESYSKAVGKGLTMDFSQIDTRVQQENARFISLWLNEAYYLSAYVESESEDMDIIQVNFNQEGR